MDEIGDFFVCYMMIVPKMTYFFPHTRCAAEINYLSKVYSIHSGECLDRGKQQCYNCSPTHSDTIRAKIALNRPII